MTSTNDNGAHSWRWLLALCSALAKCPADEAKTPTASEAKAAAAEKNRQLKADILANRAACYVQLYEPTKVKADCDEALKLVPNHGKGQSPAHSLPLAAGPHLTRSDCVDVHVSSVQPFCVAVRPSRVSRNTNRHSTVMRSRARTHVPRITARSLCSLFVVQTSRLF